MIIVFFGNPMQPTTRAVSIAYKHTKQMHHVCVTQPPPPPKKMSQEFRGQFPKKKALKFWIFPDQKIQSRSRKISNKCKFPRFFTPTNPSWQISLPPFQTFRTFLDLLSDDARFARNSRCRSATHVDTVTD